MDSEEHKHLRELRGTHQRRLYALEIQSATRGIDINPAILTEIEDIRKAIHDIERKLWPYRISTQVSSSELRSEALSASFRGDWEKAAELLSQLLEREPDDKFIQQQVEKVQHQLNVQTLYGAISDLREQSQWQAVLVGLEDLRQIDPNHPSLEILQKWADTQKRLSPLPELINKQDWILVADTVDELFAKRSNDEDIATVLAELVESEKVPRLLRIRAGKLLGQIKDLRIPIQLDEWISALRKRNTIFGSHQNYWCYIRPARYKIGGWREGEEEAVVDVEPYWIARYPVTVAQFEEFLGDAYTNKTGEWWQLNKWRWRPRSEQRHPKAWEFFPDFSLINNIPAWVNWYEAVAYTKWLTFTLKDSLGEYVLRLPTEAEWEIAASYDVEMIRHLYSWGDTDPTPEHAVYDECRPGGRLPVGCCPLGRSSCGALDMAGLAWEWTSSPIENYPANSCVQGSDTVADSEDTEFAIRGGSFDEVGNLMRNSNRGKMRPVYGYWDSAIRLVLSRRPS